MKGLSWEWGRDDNSIIIRKKKGKLTYEDVWRFMHEQEQLNVFEGALIVDMFRPMRDRCDGWDDLFSQADEGDAQMFYFIQDDTPCPICGRDDLFPQCCPACGETIKMERLDGRR